MDLLTNLNKAFFSWIIRLLLNSHCGQVVSIVGKKTDLNDCFWITFDTGNSSYVGIESYDNLSKLFSAIEFDGNGGKKGRKINIDELIKSPLQISHYYKYLNMEFYGVYKFILLFLPYRLFAIVSLNCNKLIQYIFNKRSLDSKNRFELLKLLVSKYAVRRDDFSHVSVMQLLYSSRVFNHPHIDRKSLEVIALLDGFVDTGELKSSNGKYVLTGFAHKLIEEQEEQDRKHTSSTRVQFGIFVLTFLLFIAALMQAKVIIIPTLFDLTK